MRLEAEFCQEFHYWQLEPLLEHKLEEQIDMHFLDPLEDNIENVVYERVSMTDQIRLRQIRSRWNN